MDNTKKERLESQGWKVGTVSDFLALTAQETALIEIKLALSRALKKRQEQLITQTALTPQFSTTIKTIIPDEINETEVSIDLLIKSLLATGITPQEIGHVLINLSN